MAITVRQEKEILQLEKKKEKQEKIIKEKVCTQALHPCTNDTGENNKGKKKRCKEKK